MKNSAFIILLFAATFTSCKRVEINGEVPKCIENLIKDEANSIESQFDQVWEYDFQGSKVYCFVPGSDIADGQTIVYETDCGGLCFLGGIMGETICNGDTFSTSASNPVLIWERE